KTAVNEVNTHVLNQIGKVVGFAMQRRSKAAGKSYNREHDLEDFIKNKVYYAASRRLRKESFKLDLSDQALRKLSLAGGLMAKVAHVDLDVTDQEFEMMVNALERHWGVERETAVFVAEVAVSEVADHLDHHRTVREFGLMTEAKERIQFIGVLFAVADADGFVSVDEIEEIRAIAKSMNVIHEDFIKSKLLIPKERRAT
ncbi:MAG: TerB family tellurite resistance protein, partial [Chloroflexota bacterium]